MSASILTTDAAKAANISLTEEGEGTQAVHDVVVAMRANRRSGTANTKTRGRLLNLVKNHFAKKVLVMPGKEETLLPYTVEEELFLVQGQEIILNRLIVRQRKWHSQLHSVIVLEQEMFSLLMSLKLMEGRLSHLLPRLMKLPGF